MIIKLLERPRTMRRVQKEARDRKHAGGCSAAMAETSRMEVTCRMTGDVHTASVHLGRSNGEQGSSHRGIALDTESAPNNLSSDDLPHTS